MIFLNRYFASGNFFFPRSNVFTWKVRTKAAAEYNAECWRNKNMLKKTRNFFQRLVSVAEICNFFANGQWQIMLPKASFLWEARVENCPFSNQDKSEKQYVLAKSESAVVWRTLTFVSYSFLPWSCLAYFSFPRCILAKPPFFEFPPHFLIPKDFPFAK